MHDPCGDGERYISKDLVMRNLGLGPKEFDRLATLCGVHPYVPKNRQRIDKIEGFYYRLSDANKLVHSDAYRTMVQNRRLDKRRQRYAGTGLEYKIENIRYEEHGYVDLVKERYKTFCECVDGLNHSLSELYLGRMLGLSQEIAGVLGEFEEFIAGRSLLEYSFMSQSGVYHQVSFGKIKVIWFVPYRGTELREVVEEKREEPQRPGWSELNFLDFVSSSEEESSESEECVTGNDPNKMDVSLLVYSIPVLTTHCRLALHKLRKMYSSHPRSNLFSGTRFYIKSNTVGDSLRLIVRSGGGEVVDDAGGADVYVSETADELIEGIVYVQPQYLFDCLNSKSRMDAGPYWIGKTLPKHSSPFTSMNHVISRERLAVMSRTQRNRVEDIVNRFSDVEYER